MNAANTNLMQALRGPVLLIVIGVLFTLDHFSGIGFNRTWPVILIIIGLMKLLERGMRGESAPPTVWR